MWLPNPIYRRLPTIYVVVGLLLAAGVVYIGLDRPGAVYYLILAGFCIAAGVVVQTLRSTQARRAADADSATGD